MPVAMGHGGPWLHGPRGPWLVSLPPGPYVLDRVPTHVPPPPHSSPFIPLGGLPAYPSPAWAFPLERFFFPFPLPRGVLSGTFLLGWVSSSDRGVVQPNQG